ncbi:hypothetical protein [Sphingomonas sp. KC8]|uniref:hypothetical protein n=1 Tax=Sphingomonas sp. KC8 TaxID=1030157 RepID=UPI0002488F8C|nr:hypothetical protein [Sphingomonas sp. KC8]ARS29272.1 hypothetical protein KC8_18525 [Sphingomonas sp. KC8]
MKKIVVLSLAAVATLGLGACSKEQPAVANEADANAVVADINATAEEAVADINAAVDNAVADVNATAENATGAVENAATNAM